MQTLIDFNLILLSLVVVSLVVFFSGNHLVRKFLIRFENIKIGSKVIGLFDDLVAFKKKIIYLVFVSIFIQFIGVILFYLVIYPFTDSMNFVEALCFIPIGLMSLALPIAPSGLGVGHMIFQKLFELAQINNGASLFNLYFIVNTSMNLIGLIFYLTNKTEKTPTPKIS